MKAKTISGRLTEDIRIALNGAMSDGFKPTLALVFLSIQIDREAICDLLDKEGVQIFGATTDGEIIDTEIDTNSISIMLMDLNPDYFRIIFEEVGQGGYSEVAKSVSEKSLGLYEKPAFIFTGSGIWKDPYIEKFTDGFKSVFGKDAIVFGGMAGDGFSLSDTYIFTNKKDSPRAAMVIAIDNSKVEINGIATCEWKAIGTPKTITKSIENKVYGIDGEPPLELLLRYAGITNPPENTTDLMVELNQSLQIQLQRDKGDPIMRVAIINREEGYFYFIGSMPEGSKIKFCLLPDLNILDDSIRAVQDLKKNKMTEADAVLLFACAGRLTAFGPEIKREVRGIQKIWNAPMAGFFCQGEFGKASGGELEVHNLTSICVAFKEI
ncbi:FIST signal transduction protein [Algoriphagus limi]|uniref:FIST C-terminal domain-containing protein n=1 Tax=Algoriphagus limi TaxID=2975273 RepID=A0ABT2G7R5_9BACT|nr:FIST N-terminal domain-containing protein [Algoriphagus limi]MCS5491310.1 FIST C-terminal domain-containing protein [Algoriphagus limi]